jgi:SHS2 domain-containing protein
MGYEVLDHTADFRFEVRAPDLAGLVREAIRAVADASFGADTLQPAEVLEQRFGPDDPEMTLFKVLSEVLFLLDARGLIVADADVREQGPWRLRVRFHCDRLDPERHRARLVFKAVTLHGLEVEPHDDLLMRARIVMDL